MTLEVLGLAPVFENDTLVVAILVAIVLAAAYQHQLSWSQYRRIHRRKVKYLPPLDVVFPWAVTDKKQMGQDREFYASLLIEPQEAFEWLKEDFGFTPHLISSVKRRPTEDGGVQYSVAHMVKMHDDGTQTEAYMFPTENGVDIYAHNEVSVLDPRRHLLDTQHTDGDPNDVLPNERP